MSCGTPVVASDLPGVRCAVKETGMGRIVPPRNSQAIAEAILDILDHPQRYARDPEPIRKRYAPETVALQYEALFKQLVKPA